MPQHRAVLHPPAIQYVPVDLATIHRNNHEIHCIVRNDAPALLRSRRHYVFRLTVGDRINVIVWGHPELNNPNNTALARDLGATFTINQDGTITYPYIGKVRVIGLTPEATQRTLARKLDKYLKKPTVNVNVVEYTGSFVNVLGAVNAPAKVPVTEVPLTIMQAIGKAGGENRDGNIRNVILKRGGKDYHLNLLALTNNEISHIVLFPHDTVFVSRFYNKRIYVMGEVHEPTVVNLQDDKMNLAEAISSSRGLVIQRALKYAYVLRLHRNRPSTVYALDIANPSGLILASHFHLAEGDVVYVASRSITQWSDIVLQLLPAVDLMELGTRAAANIARARNDFASG